MFRKRFLVSDREQWGDDVRTGHSSSTSRCVVLFLYMTYGWDIHCKVRRRGVSLSYIYVIYVYCVRKTAPIGPNDFLSGLNLVHFGHPIIIPPRENSLISLFSIISEVFLGRCRVTNGRSSIYVADWSWSWVGVEHRTDYYLNCKKTSMFGHWQ